MKSNRALIVLKIAGSLSLISLLLVQFNGLMIGAADLSTQRPKWANPSAITVKRVSSMPSAQSEPSYFNNLDCSLITYRLVATGNMLTGCFTDTAFGLFDSSSSTVIFNGTDEGIPLQAYAYKQILAPWPKAMNLLTIDNVNTGGTYIGLYKNPFKSVQDQRNLQLQLTSKKLTAPPDIPIKDKLGNRLVINPQTLTFSDGGSWLVAETLNGSFVRINLATLDIVAFAPSYGSQGSPALLESRIAITDDGQFVAIANQSASEFKIYDLSSCSGTVDNLRPLNCVNHNYRTYVGSQISGFKTIRHIRFVNDELLSFEATSTNPSNDGIYLLAPTSGISSQIDYLGLGDSFTGGEGAFDYLAGSDTTNNMCHLSRRSYPLLLANDLFTATGGRSVACSGAVINDASSTNGKYKGQVRNVLSWDELQKSQALLLESIFTNYLPGFVAQHRFVARYQPRILTVSIGGDDIGFGDIVRTCVLPHASIHRSDNDCYSTYEDRKELMDLIDRTVPKWISLYKQLHNEAPEAKLYSIGYPQLTDDLGSCAINVQLSKAELGFATVIVEYLNSAMAKASLKANVSYIDISNALKGHRLCETSSHNVAVNGITSGKDAGILGLKFFGKESFHPNALGHLLMEQEILRQTKNFANAPLTNTISNSQSLLSAPKSGRKINTLVPYKSLTNGEVKKGSSVVIKVTGFDAGLKPNTTYQVNLNRVSGPNLGAITSNEAGDLNGNVVIPESAPNGSNTINITGSNQLGSTVDITQPIYIPATDSDGDNDGIPNDLDSCPGAINSSQDQDKDGIDDICDPLIGLPPQANSSKPTASPPSAQGANSSTAPLTSPSITTTEISGGQTLNTEVQTTTNPTSKGKITSKTSGQTTQKLQVLGSSTKKLDGNNIEQKRPLFGTKAKSFKWQVYKIFNWQLWVILIEIALLLILTLDLWLNKLRKKSYTNSPAIRLQ